jgi:hypothetical protein
MTTILTFNIRVKAYGISDANINWQLLWNFVLLIKFADVHIWWIYCKLKIIELKTQTKPKLICM